MAHAEGEGSLRAAGLQFLRSASEPGPRPPPAVGAAAEPVGSDDEWEPEEDEAPPSAPAFGQASSSAARGRLSVADVAGAHPWHASAPAFEEETPQSWGLSLFD